MAATQIAGAAILFVLIALAPPVRGNILLVPIGTRAAGDLPALALSHGAALVQRGPLPASLIVYGERAQLLGPMAKAGVLTLSGGDVGCRPAATAA